MKTQATPVKYPDLTGSEQHLPLKNQPGEAADADHAESSETLDEETSKQVQRSDDKTQIADALRDLTDDTGS